MTNIPNVSLSYLAFNRNIIDVHRLLALVKDLEGVGKRSVIRRPGEKVVVLCKNAYVMITTCWESYIEDLCEESSTHLALHSREGRNNWMERTLKACIKREIRALNTPKSRLIDQLFLNTLGFDKLSSTWKWAGMSSESAMNILNDFIHARGNIVHRAESTTRPPPKEEVERFLDHIQTLVKVTEEAVQNYVHGIAGTYVGKVRVE